MIEPSFSVPDQLLRAAIVTGDGGFEMAFVGKSLVDAAVVRGCDRTFRGEVV